MNYLHSLLWLSIACPDRRHSMGLDSGLHYDIWMSLSRAWTNIGSYGLESFIFVLMSLSRAGTNIGSYGLERFIFVLTG